jgi:uncharacterized protein (UPF0333 family)
MLMLATRSQLSVEFIILFSGMLLIFVILFSTYFNKQQELDSQNMLFEAKSITHELAWSINSVHTSGFGTNTSITIPTTLFGKTNFNITNYGNSIWILWTGGSYSYPLITDNVSVTYSKKSQFTVYDSGNGVVVS